MQDIIIGIDASRNRSGGARNHLVGILGESVPTEHGIREVHIWSYLSLLSSIPDRPWLVKHNPPDLERTLAQQMWWQRFKFREEATRAGCAIVLNTDAATVSGFRPAITMSRDLLPYEPGELERFGVSKARLRIEALHYLHDASFRSSDGVIFLTRHAAKMVQRSCGEIAHYAIIPHGVGREFKALDGRPTWPAAAERPIECLYVSNIALYKHQWVVVRAIDALRKRGHSLRLTLVGGGPGSGARRAEQLLQREIEARDPEGRFVTQTGFIPYAELPALMEQADLFIFASSCENMPNTLLEGMAATLPIACSDRGPMREILQDGGVYFDPENESSIARAIERLMKDASLRSDSARRARELAEQYSWSRCGKETWEFLVSTYEVTRKARNGVRSAARPIQICTNCVMDTTDSQIVFDQDGVCDHCNTFHRKILPNWHTGEKGRVALERQAHEIRRAGSGKAYDCIVGVSGGTDSSYLVYVAKELMRLRPLVFHVDTGWNSRESVNNIGALLDQLGLELFTEVIDWDQMRDLQLAFFKSGVPHIDTPQDHAIFASIYHFATKHGVRYILTGANLSTECIRNPIEWMYYQSDSVQLRDIHARFGARPLTTFPTTSILWHKVYLPYVKSIKTVKPLNYVPYIREQAAELLSKRFGWEAYGEKHYESRFTKFYEGFWLYKKFGYDVRKVQYSSLILTKQMTRDEALERLSIPPFDEATAANEFEFVATKLGITVEELQSCMNGPNRTYRDYKNQEWVYSIGARGMRMLGLELGGKR